MNKISKVVILISIGIFVALVALKEVKVRPKLNLINDVKKIVANIENANYKGNILEILIDGGYELNSKKYTVDGEGVIFLEEDYSVMLSRDGMCAIKMPYSDKIMFQEAECPNYRLKDNKKVVID